ncbi:retrovirus-related Pol polyprotein from transposon 17.6 [Trichonephila clavipes]|nr:retrovirus-related Pol polyprotein from transposon 17.6 [Trichonephila clavipes]
MEEVRDRRKKWYDKNAIKREFQQGDAVLALSLNQPHKLAPQWKGTGKTNLVEHDIDLISDKRVQRKPYRMTNRQNEILKTEIERMLKYKIIEPGPSEYTSPMILVETPETWEEHLKHLQEILERLKKANLTIKPSKCKFAQREVQYLGHVVGRVAPLPNLLKGVNKKGGIVWNDKCSESFKMLKERLSGKPVLHAPDFSKPFILQTDASDQGYGVVLAQKDENGGEHPI